MFADSLLESNWANRSRRGWTTLASFALQALSVAIVVSLPLLYTEGLPKLHLLAVGTPIGPPPGQRAPAVQHRGATARTVSIISSIFSTPQVIPHGVSHDPDPLPAEEPIACLTCVPGGTGPVGAVNPVLGAFGNSATVVPPPPRPVARPPRISRMMEGNLIYKVQPIYPPMARAARIQGPVILRAIISRSGGIENLQTLTGHPMLVKAAIDAVSQWRYRPYPERRTG